MVAALIAYCARRDCSNDFWKGNTKAIRLLRRVSRFVRGHPFAGIMKQEEAEISADLNRAASIRHVVEKTNVGKRVKQKRLDHGDERILFLSEEMRLVGDKWDDIRRLEKSNVGSWPKITKLLSLDL